MDEATTIENERLMQLESSRTAEDIKTLAKSKSRVAKAKAVLSLGQKMSRHKNLLGAALVLDFTLGLIPIVSAIVNAVFLTYLYFRFGRKKFLKVGLGAGIATIIDAFVGILPVNFGAAAMRISFSEN